MKTRLLKFCLPLLLGLGLILSACQSSTSLHYTANGNFSSSGTYLPGADNFNLADVGSVGQANSLPSGVSGLLYVGQCNGIDPTFESTVDSALNNAKVYGFYLMDEPNTGTCPAANLKAESDYIHYWDKTSQTFIIAENQGPSSAPVYGWYTPANTDLNSIGLDPYPCRTELNGGAGGCNDNLITLAVNAAIADGIPLANIVPVYQTFGGGTETDDGGGHWQMPTASQLTDILNTWGSNVPSPPFDYAYSWGDQFGDTALGDAANSAQQSVMASHN